MKILGLSSNYHDASAALVVDGVPVAAAAEERFTRRKHDPSFPAQAARFCLRQAGAAAADLDLVAYHEEPEVKLSRTMCSAFAQFPFSLPTFLKSMHEAVTSGFWIRNEISKALDVHPDKVVYVPHHMSHAAHAFLSSPFEEAAVLTIDAVGEWTSTGLFRARSEGGRAAIEPIGAMPFPHSLGLVYSAFTAFLGFRVNDAECSTMALAAFGEPRFAEAVRRIVAVRPDGTYEVDLSYFDFGNWEGVPVTAKFLDAFGAPRPHKRPLPFDCLGGGAPADADSRRYADVAASVQLVLEEAVLALARRVRRETGARNLCLAGGVALNCVANGKLVDAGIFDGLFIPPDPGDGGGAMGAALFAELRETGRRGRGTALHPFLGQPADASQIAEMLPYLDPRRWERYRAAPGRPAARLDVREFGEEGALVAAVAEALARGEIVGWLQGRFENGPRALGNRSLLVDPGNLEAVRRLSRSVKHRASFRPYACSIAEEDAAKALAGALPLPARWMQVSRQVRPERLAAVRGAAHVDGSTRPQVCSAADNPRLHRLLIEFGRRKGLAALLNTSFNERGSPIVSAPMDALLMFARTDMDVLVVDRTVIRKVADA